MRHATARTFTNLLRTQTRAGKIVGSFQRGGAAARGKITRSKKQDVGDFYKAVAHASARRQNGYVLQLGEAQLLEARSKKIWLFTLRGILLENAEKERCTTTKGGAAARSKITRSKKQDVGDFYKAVAHASARRKNSYALQLGEAQLLEARKLDARGKMFGFEKTAQSYKKYFLVSCLYLNRRYGKLPQEF